MLDCIFCKIINKEIPSSIVSETDDLFVMKDIAPKAQVHYLILPKKHIANIASLSDSDEQLMGKVALMARDLSKDLPVPQAFRLITNNGEAAGQSVFHIHFHFLAGKNLPEF